MNDSLLVGVLNGLANSDEQVQALCGRECILITVFRDFSATEEFHDKIWSAQLGGTGIEYLRDVGMIHQRERLPLCLKPSDHPFRVHARFDDFQGYMTTNR